MPPQSTHTKQKPQRRYAPGTSRGTHSASTLLAQVANIERGIRIRERREALHLTQPAVVELIEEAAYALPEGHDLHPRKAGKAPVTLRGYQSYEQGGGIVWEKAKLLAQVLQMDVQAMMSGEEERAPTPDLSNGNGSGQSEAPNQLDRIEAKLDKILGLLTDDELAPLVRAVLHPPATEAARPATPRRTARAKK